MERSPYLFFSGVLYISGISLLLAGGMFLFIHLFLHMGEMASPTEGQQISDLGLFVKTKVLPATITIVTCFYLFRSIKKEKHSEQPQTQRIAK